MKKLPKIPSWKQDSPRMQLITIYQSLYGNINNVKEGFTDIKKVLDRLEKNVQELHDLIPYLEEGKWEDEL